MKDTDCYELDRDMPNLAVGYTRAADDERRKNVFRHVFKGGPAGGGFSTAPDLIRFARALCCHRLLSKELTEVVLTGKTATSRGRCGYGFQIEEISNRRIIGHSGGYAGLSAQLDIYIDQGFAAAILSNYDPPAATRVAGMVREWIGNKCCRQDRWW
jgi:CubicO group peptidase (beta-lactamase class C family)